MARVQILPLPTVKLGDAENTPFIIVLDQFADDEAWEPEYSVHLKQETGAVTVLDYRGTMDAPGALDLTEEQRTQLAQWLTQPRRWVMADRYTNTEHHMVDTTIGTTIPITPDPIHITP